MDGEILNIQIDESIDLGIFKGRRTPDRQITPYLKNEIENSLNFDNRGDNQGQ